jgi:gliding motility-associated-like protein
MKKRYLLFVLLLLLSNSLVNAQTVVSGIINNYARVTAIDVANSTLTVESTTGIQNCSVILIIQMKGATLSTANDTTFGRVNSYNSAGLYERAMIDFVDVGNKKLFLRHKLVNTYDVAGAVQVVTVPQYTNIDIIGTLQGKPFDGQTGGIIALEATGTVTVQGIIDASGIGFRGGKVNTNVPCSSNEASNFAYDIALNNAGQKGEGIFDLPSTQGSGRGRNANGGGGGACLNGGGGGGASFGAGGLGGRSPLHIGNSALVSGIGGHNLAYNNQNRLFLGGGGGAGHQDNSAATDGGNGGGIVYIVANQLVGGGIINASGFEAANAGTDGAGGGGGAGTIALNIANRPILVNLLARGGNGGNNSAAISAANQCFAAGGGGGGGAVIVNGSATLTGITVALQGGAAGKVTNAASQCAGTTHGATAGTNGSVIGVSTWTVPQGTTEQLLLNITVTTTAAACADTQQSFTATNVAGVSYQWQRNGEDVPNATGVTFNATESGVYRLKASFGCKVFFSPNFPVNIKNTPIAFIIGNSIQAVCTNGTGTFLQATQGAGYTYQWRRNGTNITGATNSSFSATQIGEYDVVVTGCGGSATSNKINLVASVATTVPTIIGNSVVCPNNTVRLQVNNHIVGSIYQWRFNGVNIIGANAPFLEATQVGTYTVANLSSCNTDFSAPFLLGLGEGITQAVITGSPSICPNSTSILRATRAVGGTYTWFRNDTLITGATTENLTIGQAGRYVVQITDACKKTHLSAPFIVQTTTITQPFIRGQGLLCQGEAPLTTPRIPTYRYQWYQGGGALPNATDTIYVARAAGRYTVEVTDTCGQTRMSPIFFVNDDNLGNSTLSITADRQVVCTPADNIRLTANTDAVNATLQWQRNGADIPNATGNIYTTNVAGTYTVRLKNSCSTLTSSPLVIRQGTLPEAVITGANTFCVGTSTILRTNTGDGLSYQWFLNGEPLNGAINAQIPVFTAGSYTVRIVNADGCATVSAPFVTTISSLGTPTVSQSRTICAGDRVNLFAQAQGAIKYTWTPATGLNNPNIATPVATPTQTTLYTVKMENQFGCFVERQVRIEVVPAITADFEIETTTQCGDKTTVKLISKITNIEAFADVLWSMGNGDTLKGTTPPIYTYKQSGTYSITLTVNNRVCSQTVRKSVEIENLDMGNVITPNEDGKNDKLIIDTPNEGWKLKIFDRFGRSVYESENYDNSWGERMPPGTYFYQLVSPKNKECKGWLQVLSTY